MKLKMRPVAAAAGDKVGTACFRIHIKAQQQRQQKRRQKFEIPRDERKKTSKIMKKKVFQVFAFFEKYGEALARKGQSSQFEGWVDELRGDGDGEAGALLRKKV